MSKTGGRLFTSESVTEGHPDKICDAISDSVLDALLTEDPRARVAVETLVTTGQVHVVGEVTTSAYADIPKIVRDRVLEIGYDSSSKGFDGNSCGVNIAIGAQSPEIAGGVDVSHEARSGVLTDDEVAQAKATYDERRRMSWRSGGGSPHVAHPKLTMEVTPEERRQAFEKRWELGGVLFSKTFSDQMINLEANEEARKFYEEKIRAVIDDPEVADLLIPDDHPIGTKRICTDTNYFQTFNRPNVKLISVRKTPIQTIDATGIVTSDARYDIDALVLATGFDAMTGTLAKIDIVGRGGRRLVDDWADGPRTYLGLGVDGFPNLFLVSGPGAPAVLANMVLHAEAHVNWIADAIAHLDQHGYAALEATPDAVDNWIAECNRRADATLFPKANSWYMGANVPGKPRVFMLFIGGFAAYLDICAEVAGAGYKGFSLLEPIAAER